MKKLLLNIQYLSALLRCAFFLVLVSLPFAGLNAHAPHSHQHDDDHEDEHRDHVELTPEIAAQSGLTTAIAEPGILHQQLKLYGQVSADPEQVRTLSARFPGVINTVNVSVGSTVNARDVLATVEANESLRSYNIVSPIAGVVVARHANAGEATGDKILFTVANYDRLVVNMAVFPQDAARVRSGQTVLLQSGHAEISSTIDALTPAIANSPGLNARAVINNEKSEWISNEWVVGEWISAYTTVAEIPVALRVDNRALQNLRDQQVVFVQEGDHYEIRAVQLGQTDGQFTEVLAGLDPGESYVVENSYLLKADLEKSGAAHDH